MTWEELRSVDEWLNEYVPGANPPHDMFAPYDVELGGYERDMSPGWVEGLNRDIQMVKWTEFQALDMSELSDSATIAHTAKRSTCPNIGIYPRNRRENWSDYDPPSEADVGERDDFQESISDIPMPSRVSFSWVELLVVVLKHNKEQTDAMQDSCPMAHHKDQLADYANEVFNRQHRLSFCIIVVLNDHARLVRFDRRGAVMTPEFNYIREPDVIGTFLYRLSRLDYAGRGYDPTVEAASEEDERTFRALAVQYAHHRSTTATGLRGAATKGWRIYKVAIEAPFSNDAKTSVRRNSDLARHQLLIGKPAHVKGSLFGRGTRGFVAYDLSSQQVIFLKDSWRSDSEHTRSEFDNYMLIRESVHEDELHIPTLLGGGDVQHNGIIQRTHTLTACDHPLIHFRLVFKEVCRRLEDSKDALQLLTAVADACGAHMEVWVACKLLHRDVSVGNILIYNPHDDEDPDSDNVVGLLADWEFAETEDELARGNVTQQTRTGTWQFMSARLQQFPEKRHELADDIESFYHVLNWCALLHLPHEDADDVELLAKFMYDLYDYATAEDPERGHPQKLRYMTQGTPFVTFPELQGQVKHPLDGVLKALAKLFQRHYYHIPYPPVSSDLAPNLVMASQKRPPRPVRSWAKKITEYKTQESLPGMQFERDPASLFGARDPARSPLRHHDDVLACFLSAMSTTRINSWPQGDRVAERPITLPGTTIGKRASGSPGRDSNSLERLACESGDPEVHDRRK